jgi:hypothetical protein
MRKLLFVLLFAASATVGAAESRQFAVLSLIGDKLLVAQYAQTSGFQTEAGLQALVSLDDNSFDKVVLQTVDAALKSINMTASPVLLVAKDTSLYDAQAVLSQTGKGTKDLLPIIMPMVRGSGATHLILVTKLKHAARVQQLKDTFMGSGELEGLGFYVDSGRVAPAVDGKEALPSTPVLGPFAYFKLELVDLARGEILKTEEVVASRVFTNPGSSNAWATLTNQEKIAQLQDIVRRETAKAVPVLLGMPRLN